MTPADPPEETPHEDLTKDEVWWFNHVPWLDRAGYTLRARYRPGWKPSWTGSKRMRYGFEDGHRAYISTVLDAVRKSDGVTVALKKVSKRKHPYEVEIGRYFSSEPLSTDTRNHCYPLYDVLQVPDDEDIAILVMPFLRTYNDPRYATIGEAVAFFRQVFEGLQFMHSHHVAHRDCTSMNIMMDASSMYPQSYHPAEPRLKRDASGFAKYHTRTSRPPRYYLTDFGLSRRYDADNKNPLEIPIFGGDKTVPEFRKDPTVPRNPFHTDVYYLGSMIRKDFLTFYTNFTFMQPLVDAMAADDPASRPTMDEVVERFDKISSKLSWWTLRSRARRRTDAVVEHAAKDVYHVFRTAYFLVTRRSAIPSTTSRLLPPVP